MATEIWQKIINAFNKAKLKYIVVGAAALAIHGFPRSTLDIDIYIPATTQVLKKLFQITDELGLKSTQRNILGIGHSPDLFANQWICFSWQTQDVLDVFFAAEDDFGQLYRASKQKKDKNTVVRVASLKDIIKMKKASGRPVDLADLKLIKEGKKYKS